MIKNALIQSNLHTESDVRQARNIYLQNIDWECVIPILMILLGHVINKSSLDEPFTTETIEKCINFTKEFVEKNKRMLNKFMVSQS